MTQPLLSAGKVEAEYLEADERESLRDEIRDLRAQLTVARHEAQQAKREAARAVSRLRQVLSPLYNALRDVFGELDAVGGDDPAAPAMDSRQKAIWESWKQKMPGKPALAIDALILNGEMNSQAIAVAIGMHRNNVPKVMHKLNLAGILGKNGNKYYLKQS